MNKKLTSLSLAGVMLLSTASPVFAATEAAMKEAKEPNKMEQLVKDGKEKTIIKGIQSHREIVLVATPEEIKNASKTSSTQREQLDLYLNSIKGSLPNKVDDGLIFSDVDIKGKLFVMFYTIDEKMYDMKEVDKNKNEFKNNVEKDLKTEGELIKLASLLVPLDMSLRVSYVGSISKEQANVDIPSSYLKEVVLDNRLSNHFK